MEHFICFQLLRTRLWLRHQLRGETSKTSSSKKSTNQTINKKLFLKADSRGEKYLSCPPVKLSKYKLLILDGVQTGASLSAPAQKLRRKKADLPENYFVSSDAAGISRTPVLNQNASAKAGRRGVPLTLWTSEAATLLQTGWCCSWICAQFSECWQSTKIKSETGLDF